MQHLLFVVVAISSVYCKPSSPIYSSRYANVYYQPALDDRGHYVAELNLPGPQNVPQIIYALPVESTAQTEVVSTNARNKTTVETATEPNSEQINTENIQTKPDSEKLTTASELSDLNEQGVYYIYHPSGLLQKVVYVTKDDVANMEYSAQLKYQNVEPINDPIYTYDPNTFEFQRLQL